MNRRDQLELLREQNVLSEEQYERLLRALDRELKEEGRRPAFPQCRQYEAAPNTMYQTWSDLAADQVMIVAEVTEGPETGSVRMLRIDGRLWSAARNSTNAPDGERALLDSDYETILQASRDLVLETRPKLTRTVIGRALHLCDIEVMALAMDLGEASRRPGEPPLLERGPKVIETVEKMWARDELGLRTKWLEVAGRVMDALGIPRLYEDEEE